MTLALSNSTGLILVGLALVAIIVALVLGRRVDVKFGKLHAQLTPNGGASMRDAVDRIETKVDQVVTRVSALEQAHPTSVNVAAVVTPPSPGDAA